MGLSLFLGVSPAVSRLLSGSTIFSSIGFAENGGQCRTRTCDLLLVRQAL